MQPLVTICLPNLNKRPYLEARLDSILQQTYPHWELIVCDCQSTDGSWEYLQERLGEDPRATLFQETPAFYGNWNACLQKAQGKYIYIATSDDTMRPQALERFVEALEAQPDCGLAHCNLEILDDDGQAVPDFLPKCFFAQYFGDLLQQPHIRHAPHDGLLHFSGNTVYLSVTAFCIRRTALEQYGDFRTDFGSQADFEWGMRYGCATDVVHIPEVLASWRIASDQATSFEVQQSVQQKANTLRMIELAIDKAKAQGTLNLTPKQIRLYSRHQRLAVLKQRLLLADGLLGKVGLLTKTLFTDVSTFVAYLDYKNGMEQDPLSFVKNTIKEVMTRPGITVLNPPER